MSNSGPGPQIDNTPKEGPRVLAYTRTYRMQTELTDEEIISWAQEATPMVIESVDDALELISRFHDYFGKDGPEDKVTVELHNTQIEEKDPGFF